MTRRFLLWQVKKLQIKNAQKLRKRKWKGKNKEILQMKKP